MMTLRPMVLEDADDVLNWRNLPRVRQNMVNPEPIARDDHLAWMPSILASPSHRYWIVEWDGRGVGVINLADIDETHKHCTWGYYIGAEDVPAAAIVGAPRLLFEIVFEEMGMHRLSAEVLATNTRVVGLNRALGFVEEGTLSERYRHGNEYIDAVQLRLLSSEWRKRYRKDKGTY